MLNHNSRFFKFFFIIAGLATCSMIYAVIAPQAALTSSFGESLTGPLAEVIVRNWGFLIFLIGLLLLISAFKTNLRLVATSLALTSKSMYLLLILSFGQIFIEKAAVMLLFDASVVLLLAIYLLKAWQQDK